MIRGPPEAPVINLTFDSLSVIIIGLIDDRGRFLGAMKFSLEAVIPWLLVVFGVEKSSISSFKIICVEGDIIPLPKWKLIVLVADTASPFTDNTAMEDVPAYVGMYGNLPIEIFHQSIT